jgi:serine/threonine protein kinase
MPLEVGQIIGDYEIIGRIGAGGMGDVYKVRNVISERIDAMKALRPQADSSPDAASRFLREIRVQASMKHPNIAALYTAMNFDGQILMFMELLDGIGLDQKLRRGSLPPAEAVHYASQCLHALEYAHERGVVHRDIKPSNLIISPTGIVKLLDFGIARNVRDLVLTGTGMAVGSAHYMSPEQVLGREVDGRSDLYSMGIMLYEMLIGARPFAGDAYSILKAHVEQEPLSPADLNPGLPPELCDAILRALSKDRERRFPNAGAFRAALEGTASGVSLTSEGGARAQPEVSQKLEPPISVDSATASRIVSLLATEVGPIAAHLVKQACARTTGVREVCGLVAEQIPNESRRRFFLDQCEHGLQLPPLTASGRPSKDVEGSNSSTKSTAWNPQALDRVKRMLAEHLGPVATVIVDKAARKCSNIDELYGVLAQEIAAPADRTKFLASKPIS